MIVNEGGGVRIRLSGHLYALESLKAAAKVLAPSVAVDLRPGVSGGHIVRLAPARGCRVSKARLHQLAGEFLNEALNVQVQRLVGQVSAARTKPVWDHVFAKTFFDVPKDPLEQIEPQVAEDRREETKALMKTAEAMRRKRRARR